MRRSAPDDGRRAVGRLQQRAEHLERRRLAGPVGPEEADDLALAHSQVDAAHRLDGPAFLPRPLNVRLRPRASMMGLPVKSASVRCQAEIGTEASRLRRRTGRNGCDCAVIANSLGKAAADADDGPLDRPCTAAGGAVILQFRTLAKADLLSV